MPILDSYLFFNGNCAQALAFYQKTLGGELQAMMKYSDSPEPEQCGAGPGASAEDRNRIMHATLVIDGRNLMASDAPPGQPVPAQAGFALSLNYVTADEARRVFDALSAGGQVTMPMAKTFWAEIFGMLTDRFGTPWMVGGGECLK